MQKDTVEPNKTDNWVGTTFVDRYQILSLIGEGGMGLVFKARHVLMNRMVAIKIIRSELGSNTMLLQRFKQEAMAVSKLHHTNIVAVYDFGVTVDGTPFLVMDYLDGTSLAEIIAKHGKLSVDRAVTIFMQAAHALKHAHEKGVIHRDLKSSNLMICSEDGKSDVVKVVDFGMAKLLRPETDNLQAQELTQLGDVFGSPLYMSPEQCKGQQLDERSDIYSLGCVMYYAMCGRPPFMGENVLDTMQQQINNDPKPLMQYDAAFPETLNEVILKAMRKEPERRYQKMEELVLDLDAVTSGKHRLVATQQIRKPIFAEGASPKRPVGHNFELNLIVAAFIFVICFGAIAFVSGRLFEVADVSQELNMWADRNIEGNHYRAAGKLVQAERCYQEATTEALKFGRNDPRLAKSLVLLGATYAQDAQFSRAESTLKRAMSVLEKCYGPNCPELSTVLLTLARTYEDQGEKAKAAEIRRRAMALLDDSAGAEPEKKR